MTERAQAVVIGGGPAGLAAAAALAAENIRAVVLEADPQVGERWSGHYDRLHLHTSRRLSGLPGFAIPRKYGRFPDRDSVASYLREYAAAHDLDVRTGHRAEVVDRVGTDWVVRAAGQSWQAPLVVVATGYANVPHLPTWPGIESFTGELVHVAHYRNPAPYRGRDVLVVGPGNSGAEVSVDLAEGGAGRVRLAVRTPPNILPKTILGVPAQAYAIVLRRLPVQVADALLSLTQRVFLGDLAEVGLGKPPRGAFTQLTRDDVTPILDVGLLSGLALRSIERTAGVVGFEGDAVLLSDGSRLTPDAVVVATGYRRGLTELVGHLGVLDPQGRPVVSGASAQPAAPGLHFVGFRPAPSGNLREIAIESRQLARAVRHTCSPHSGPSIRQLTAQHPTDSPPVVLLHGVGAHRGAWAPVRDLLVARGRDVITVDLPGPDGLRGVSEATALVAGELDSLGIGRADIVGHSVGGWVALELARAGRARSVVAIAPAGLWSRSNRRFARISLALSAILVRTLDRALPGLTANPATRTLLLSQFTARPWRVPAPAALALTRNLARSETLKPQLEALFGEELSPLELAEVPLTVAFAQNDRLVRRPSAVRLAELLPTCTVHTLRGCGHVPFWDDPEQVALLIATSTRVQRAEPDDQTGNQDRDGTDDRAHRSG